MHWKINQKYNFYVSFPHIYQREKENKEYIKMIDVERLIASRGSYFLERAPRGRPFGASNKITTFEIKFLRNLKENCS